MTSPIRRIVTGHDTAGVAKVIIDGPATNARQAPGGQSSTLMWCTDAMPTDIVIGETPEDMGARKLGTPPPDNGTRFTVIEFPPGVVTAMHRTDTVDYVIVISGEVEMAMDDSTVAMKAGDIMIQRGTNHAWANRGSVPAKVAFVLVDAKPIGIGDPVTRGTSVPHR